MEAHNNPGVRHMRTGDYERAAAEFQKAAELDPAAVLAHTNLALALLALKRHREAEAAAGRALQVDPAFLPARYALGLISAARNDCSAQAVENLKKASDQLPVGPLGCRALPGVPELKKLRYRDNRAARLRFRARNGRNLLTAAYPATGAQLRDGRACTAADVNGAHLVSNEYRAESGCGAIVALLEASAAREAYPV